MKNPRTAVLLIGQIRISGVAQRLWWQSLNKQLKQYEVYIATYESYAALAKEVSDKLFIMEDTDIDARKFLKLPPSQVLDNTSKLTKFTVLWQHHLLSSLITKFSEELSQFENIIKIRNDVLFNLTKIESGINSNPHFIHLSSDLVFGCKSKIFMEMFRDNNLIDYIRKTWNKDEMYQNINYANLYTSMVSSSRHSFKWEWLNYSGIDKVEIDEIIRYSKKQLGQNQPTIDMLNFEDKRVKSAKPFPAAFSSEKHILLFFLYYRPVKSIRHVMIIRSSLRSIFKNLSLILRNKILLMIKKFKK